MPTNAQISAQLHSFHTLVWRRQWQPTPVLLPGKSHGQRSMVGYSPRGCKESDTNEWLHFHFEYSSALPFFGIGMKTDLFQSCGDCWIFQICWNIECSTLTASSSRIWNSSTGIPSPPLALFVVMLSKAHLTSHSRYLALGEWSHHHDYLGREALFVQFFCVFLPLLLNIFSFC